jgi:hypothetical protein
MYKGTTTTTTGTSEQIMGAAGRSLQNLLGSYTKKGVCLNECSPHTAADRASSCPQLSNMRMCKCSTATTGASQQNMGVAGPSLQGLYGRPKDPTSRV